MEAHIAAEEGDVPKLIKLFLEDDKSPFETDRNGMTPLHHAAGHPAVTKEIAVEMVKTILGSQYFTGVQGANEATRTQEDLVNVNSHNGVTALDLACKRFNKQVIGILVERNAVLSPDSQHVRTDSPMWYIYSYYPDIVLRILGKSISINPTGKEPLEDNLTFTVDFRCITGNTLDADCNSTHETTFLMRARQRRHKEILLHPAVQLFLHYKWQKLRAVFWISTIHQVLWILLYLRFVVLMYSEKFPYKPSSNSSEFIVGRNNTIGSKSGIECLVGSGRTLLAWFLTAMSFVAFLVEVVKIKFSPSIWEYFRKSENCLRPLTIVASIWSCWPVLFAAFQNPDYDDLSGGRKALLYIPRLSYIGASVGSIFASSLILLQAKRIPRCSFYIRLFLKVLRRYFVLVLMFSPLLAAFVVSFCVLMPEVKDFGSLNQTTFKVLVMMTGEMGYDDIFMNTPNAIHFRTLSQVLAVLFAIVVTSVLFNLLTGFTVNDIQAINLKSNVYYSKHRIEEIYALETILVSGQFRYLMSKLNVRVPHLLQRFMVIPVFKGCNLDKHDRELYFKSIAQPLNVDLNKLPKQMKKELLQYVQKRLDSNDT